MAKRYLMFNLIDDSLRSGTAMNGRPNSSSHLCSAEHRLLSKERIFSHFCQVRRPSSLTDINKTDTLGILEEVEHHRDVLQLLRTEVRPFIVASDFLLRENFN